MSIWMKWAVPSVLEVFSATFVLNRWIWLFRQSVIIFKNFKILSDFDAPAKKYFICNDNIPFRTRSTFSVPFCLNSCSHSTHFWPNQIHFSRNSTDFRINAVEFRLEFFHFRDEIVRSWPNFWSNHAIFLIWVDDMRPTFIARNHLK